MKHLNESLLSKKTGLYNGSFPNSPSIMSIKAFLDSKGFEDYTNKGPLTDTSLMTRCKYGNNRGYKIGPCETDGTWWIMFGDKSKSFMCRDVNHLSFGGDNCRITYGRGAMDSYYVDFDKFKTKVLNYFNWK